MRLSRWSWFSLRSCLWILCAAGSLGAGAASDAEDLDGQPVSSLASPGLDGRLVYTPYANCRDTRKLNILPDWSFCGYLGGGVKIPEVPVMITIAPAPGDNRARIQAAIDQVAGLPPDAKGFRGAVLLTKGRYPVAGTLRIDAGGVVLRGEGQGSEGTVIVDTGQDQDTLIVVAGGGRADFTGTRTPITDSFVPVGATRFQVSSARAFSVGDRVIVHRQTNDKWIDDLDMRQYYWTASYYEDRWERVITQVVGNRITVDAPVVQAIDQQYGGGEIYKCAIGWRIRQVGIENLRLESEYDGPTDETHGWNGIQLSNVEDAWVRQVTSRYFGYSCVSVGAGARNVTVEDCACLDPKSQITGSRRYSFNVEGCCFVLVQRCFAREGRHDFVTHARVPGPNAFVDCLAVNCYADSGNHHRYAEGTLFDNVKVQRLAVENREDSGATPTAPGGHGWSGAQTLFWNCEAKTVCHTPRGAMNWAIGIVGERALGSWAPQEPLGFWESQGAHVFPRSLYYRQLQDRLGLAAVAHVTTPTQRIGTIWSELFEWSGGSGTTGNDQPPQGPASTPGVPGKLTPEDFETNSFQKYPWVHGGDAHWVISGRESHSGSYSAASGSIADGERSVLKVTLTCRSGQITFYHKVSSEPACDGLAFFIDGVQKGTWSGQEDWTAESFAVAAGTRTFEWVYSKDSATSEGSDTAWIDDIVFPLDVAETPVDVPPPTAPEVAGIDLYLDAIGPNIVAPGLPNVGLLDFYCRDNPAAGSYCIHWTGVDQYGAISFRFATARNLSAEVSKGFAVELWTRCNTPNAQVDLRFIDTKTSQPGDHPWRMRRTLDRNLARWNGEWNHLQIPLSQFSEHGSWDDNRWYNPIGAFDWKAVERFEIVAEYSPLQGIHLYFDNLRVINPSPTR